MSHNALILIANPTCKSDNSDIALGVLVGVLVTILAVSIIANIYCFMKYKNYSFKIRLRFPRSSTVTTKQSKSVFH